jgi:arabinonate dehydratase
MTIPRTVRLSADDNVVVAVDPIATGTVVADATARERVPRGHKMAVAAIAANAPVRKYGQIIGFAARAVAPGDCA